MCIATNMYIGVQLSHLNTRTQHTGNKNLQEIY